MGWNIIPHTYFLTLLQSRASHECNWNLDSILPSHAILRHTSTLTHTHSSQQESNYMSHDSLLCHLNISAFFICIYCFAINYTSQWMFLLVLFTAWLPNSNGLYDPGVILNTLPVPESSYSCHHRHGKTLFAIGVNGFCMVDKQALPLQECLLLSWDE
jgi:hypothetical protein